MVTSNSAAAGTGPADMGTVLGKAVAVLDAFTADDPQLSLAELGRRTGLAKGTLHRVAAGLVSAGLLERTGIAYRLSTRLFALGMRASLEISLIEVATPFLEDLYEHTHETVHLGVREGLDVVYIAKIGGHRQVAAPSRIGGRMPLHCTALGKVLLAYAGDDALRDVLRRGLTRTAPRTITSVGILSRQLETVADTGLAEEYEESAVGLACLAAPVTDADGHVIAAISVTGPVTRFRPAACHGAVRAAAAGISAALARRAELRR